MKLVRNCQSHLTHQKWRQLIDTHYEFLLSLFLFYISTNWSRFSQKQTLSLGTTYPLWLQSFQMILFFMVKSIKIDGHQSAPSLVTKTSLVFTVMSWHFCQQKGAKNCLPKKDKKKWENEEEEEKSTELCLLFMLFLDFKWVSYVNFFKKFPLSIKNRAKKAHFFH